MVDCWEVEDLELEATAKVSMVAEEAMARSAQALRLCELLHQRSGTFLDHDRPHVLRIQGHRCRTTQCPKTVHLCPHEWDTMHHQVG